MSQVTAALLAARTHSFEITVGEEPLTLLLLKPLPDQLVAAGFPQVAFSHTTSPVQRLEAIGQHMKEAAKDTEKIKDMTDRLFEACLVEPRYYRGPLDTARKEELCWALVEPFALPLFNRLMELAGLKEAQAAAKTAEAFRKNRRRKADQPGGQAVRPAPV